jgi:hypothetical protein
MSQILFTLSMLFLLGCQDLVCDIDRCLFFMEHSFWWRRKLDAWWLDSRILKSIRRSSTGFRGVVELLKDQKGGLRSKMFVLLAIVLVTGIMCETNARSLGSTIVQFLQKCCWAWRSRIGNRYRSLK